MPKSFALLLVFITTHAQASIQLFDWNEKGNGGDAVICINSSQNKMYDAFEAEVRHNLQLQLPPALLIDTSEMPSYTGIEDLDESLRVSKILIDRVQHTDPGLYNKLAKTLSVFKERVRFVANTNLIGIEDMGLAFLPKNCELQQLVIQRPPKFSSDRLYTIALDHWKVLSIHHKATAIVHEVLYTVALTSREVESSEYIRYFNALLLADRLKDLNRIDYQNIYNMTFGTSDSDSNP